jgi:L-alanine-DL-glutamate epimerase-like enolase superfamily enzyme
MKIASVETIPVSQPVRPDLAIVSAAGKHSASHYLFIKISTDEGTAGHGEATLAPVWSGECQSGAQHIIREILAPLLIGKDPLRLNVLVDSMDRALTGNPFTKAAIEMALVDLIARIHRIPAYNLLGGPRRDPEIRLKFSIGAFLPVEAARVAQHALALGISAVKVKVGFDVTQDIARVEAVRSEVGPECRIAVDANGGWTESDARRAIPHLERLNVNAIEQPIRRGDFRGCARLRQHTAIPIIIDESIFTPQDALRAIRSDACDLISIYPGKNGGIFRSLEIAQMAAAAGLACVIGSNLEMDLGTAAMLHLAVSVPALATTVDHDIIGPLYYERHFTDSPVCFKNGCAIVDDRIGPGISIDLPMQ